MHILPGPEIDVQHHQMSFCPGVKCQHAPGRAISKNNTVSVLAFFAPVASNTDALASAVLFVPFVGLASTTQEIAPDYRKTKCAEMRFKKYFFLLWALGVVPLTSAPLVANVAYRSSRRRYPQQPPSTPPQAQRLQSASVFGPWQLAGAVWASGRNPLPAVSRPQSCFSPSGQFSALSSVSVRKRNLRPRAAEFLVHNSRSSKGYG